MVAPMAASLVVAMLFCESEVAATAFTAMGIAELVTHTHAVQSCAWSVDMQSGGIIEKL